MILASDSYLRRKLTRAEEEKQVILTEVKDNYEFFTLLEPKSHTDRLLEGGSYAFYQQVADLTEKNGFKASQVEYFDKFIAMMTNIFIPFQKNSLRFEPSKSLTFMLAGNRENYEKLDMVDLMKELSLLSDLVWEEVINSKFSDVIEKVMKDVVCFGTSVVKVEGTIDNTLLLKNIDFAYFWIDCLDDGTPDVIVNNIYDIPHVVHKRFPILKLNKEYQAFLKTYNTKNAEIKTCYQEIEYIDWDKTTDYNNPKYKYILLHKYTNSILYEELYDKRKFLVVKWEDVNQRGHGLAYVKQVIPTTKLYVRLNNELAQASVYLANPPTLVDSSVMDNLPESQTRENEEDGKKFISTFESGMIYTVETSAGDEVQSKIMKLPYSSEYQLIVEERNKIERDIQSFFYNFLPNLENSPRTAEEISQREDFVNVAIRPRYIHFLNHMIEPLIRRFLDIVFKKYKGFFNSDLIKALKKSDTTIKSATPILKSLLRSEVGDFMQVFQAMIQMIPQNKMAENINYDKVISYVMSHFNTSGDMLNDSATKQFIAEQIKQQQRQMMMAQQQQQQQGQQQQQQ